MPVSTAMSPLTVVTVLKTGGRYTVEWVRRLRRQVQEHLPGASFACLSDDPEAPCRVPLVADLPGWWSKAELFRLNVLSGRVLYLDLSCLLRAYPEIAEYTGPFAALSDWWAPGRIQSSAVMAWDGDNPPPLWEMLHLSPPARMSPAARFDLWWNQHVVAEELQTLYPGMVASYKEHGLESGPEDYAIVDFHGTPKVADLPDDHWAARHWRGE